MCVFFQTRVFLFVCLRFRGFRCRSRFFAGRFQHALVRVVHNLHIHRANVTRSSLHTCAVGLLEGGKGGFSPFCASELGAAKACVDSAASPAACNTLKVSVWMYHAIRGRMFCAAILQLGSGGWEDKAASNRKKHTHLRAHTAETLFSSQQYDVARCPQQHKATTNKDTSVLRRAAPNLVENVVPEELEDVPLARLGPLACPASLVRPLVQGAELQEQPQQPPVVILAFG